MSDSQTKKNLSDNRLLSLDVMRGLIMIFLASESCQIYTSLRGLDKNGSFSPIINQFFHHPWHGLRFWDLIQPAFMMMAGSALYIAYYNKLQKEISWSENLKHISIRCFKLFLFGVALHCVYAGELVWELWNVLVQLSITTIIAYLIIRKSNGFQIVISVSLLVLTEILYRYSDVPGYNQPFTEHHNFGTFVDTILMGKINEDGWVAINFIPTAVHTIIGVLVGKLLISDRKPSNKILSLVKFGLLGLILGFTLDGLGITPIIKRISTSSFVLASAGWVILMMAFLYWLTDIKKANKYAWIFVVVGLNSIFIYLFFETLGVQWLNGVVHLFIGGFTTIFRVSPFITNVFAALFTLILEWYLCFWLFKRKIIFKI